MFKLSEKNVWGTDNETNGVCTVTLCITSHILLKKQFYTLPWHHCQLLWNVLLICYWGPTWKVMT